MKKALVFDPYLDTLGGGERYALSFALALKNLGYAVELAWPESQILIQAKERFGIDFAGIEINSEGFNVCSGKTSLWQKIRFTKKYDLVFWVSDGSLPFLFSKNNLVHFQIPFTKLGGNSYINSLKTLFVKKFVYNSEFTRHVVEKKLSARKGLVLYPPIDVDSLLVDKKEMIILSVARFGSPSHSKRQDVLIEAFREFSKAVNGYKLVLTGGVVGNGTVLETLKTQIGNLNIEIVPGPDFETLKNLYSKARFFWHAAGFDIDEEKEPEKVEHFGMTTVEAMASGCIPLVIAKGGQKEILTSFPELLCETSADIADKTAKLSCDPSKLETLIPQLTSASKLYSQSIFDDKISNLVK
jgi:glycosyltransferase involved in cell wall biosynthesis